MQFDELLAREAIKYTLALYHKNGDAGDYDNHVNVFHPDAEMSIQDKTIKGAKQIIEMLRAGAVSRGAFEGKNFQRHHLTTSMIELTSENTAEAKHYIIVMTELGFDHTGTYMDQLVKQGDRWLLKTRRATMEWARSDSRFVQWLGKPTRGQTDVTAQV
jgi:hypothetical protein